MGPLARLVPGFGAEVAGAAVQHQGVGGGPVGVAVGEGHGVLGHLVQEEGRVVGGVLDVLQQGLPQRAVLPVPPAGGEGGCLVEEGLLPRGQVEPPELVLRPVDVVQPLVVEPPDGAADVQPVVPVGHQHFLPLAGDVADEALGGPGLLGGGDAAAGVDVVRPVLDHADLAPHVLPGVADGFGGKKPHRRDHRHHGGHQGQAAAPGGPLDLRRLQHQGVVQRVQQLVELFAFHPIHPLSSR